MFEFIEINTHDTHSICRDLSRLFCKFQDTIKRCRLWLEITRREGCGMVLFCKLCGYLVCLFCTQREIARVFFFNFLGKSPVSAVANLPFISLLMLRVCNNLLHVFKCWMRSYVCSWFVLNSILPYKFPCNVSFV